MKRKLKAFRQKLPALLRTPSFIMLMISLVFLTYSVTYTGMIRPFNSDDIYWQQAISTWLPFNGHTFYFGVKDIFVTLAPFFALFELLFEPSRKLIILESLLLTAGSFVFFYVSSLYFLRYLKVRLSYINLMPFVWLASFGYPIVQNYLNSNWRTFLLGFSFATIALAIAVFNGDIKPWASRKSKTVFSLVTFYIGVLIYSDPYYLFFTLAPLLLFTIIVLMLRRIDRSKAIIVIGSIATSLVIYKILAIIGTKAGIQIGASVPAAFVNFQDIGTNIITSIHGLLIIFNADFFGRSIAEPGTLGLAVNAAVVALIGWLCYRYYRTQKLKGFKSITLPQLWVLFFMGVMGLVFLTYTSSTLVNLENFRYFIVLVFCAITLLAVLIGTTDNRFIRLTATAFMVIATIFNLGYASIGENVANQENVRHNRGNAVNYDIIHEVETVGLKKGYANFWQGNINTYLAANRVTFLPTACKEGGETFKFLWLIDGKQFERSADRTFYIIDPDIPKPATCPRADLERQFGRPVDVITVYNKTILIYDYDIGERM